MQEIKPPIWIAIQPTVKIEFSDFSPTWEAQMISGNFTKVDKTIDNGQFA